MSCIYCFLSDEMQHKLKVKSRANTLRFEDDLYNYKENFIDTLLKLDVSSSCPVCHNYKNNQEVVFYLEEIRRDLQSKEKYIVTIFDKIIDIYVEFISKNHEKAYCKMINFLEKYSTNYTSVNAMQLCKPMFRVRSKDNKYDATDIREFFHIPFTKRYIVGNQRYSVAGQPMSYMAETLQIALSETNQTIDQVNVAMFFPRYSSFYEKGMYDISNGLFQNLNAEISEAMTQLSKPKYDNSLFTFSKKNMDKMIADYILYQILQYPTKEDTKGVFVQEYVLPQLMMEVVQNKADWLGLQYQTSKPPKYVNKENYRRFPNLNYCFLIPYKNDTEYSEEYLGKFFYVVYLEGEADVELEKVKEKIEECYEHCRAAQSKRYIVKEYFHYVTNVKMYLDELTEVNTEEYTKSKEFQIEKKLLYRFLDKIDSVICNPEKYCICKYR